MEPTYDYSGAGKLIRSGAEKFPEGDDTATALSQIMEDRAASPHSSLQLVNMLASDSEKDKIKVATYGGLGRLVQDDGTGGGPEEVVAAFQGIICKKELPPVVDKIRSKVRFLRQGVSLTAFGANSMDRIFEKVAEVHGIFQRAFGDRLQDCSVFSSFQTYPALDASNRYFMPREDVDANDVCELGREVDPQGYLTGLAGSSFAHTTDNTVLYYERRRSGNDGNYTFDKAQPTVFQLGDIVEVQVSFVVLPQRDNKVKLTLILRSISLLNKAFAQDSLTKKIAALKRTRTSEGEKSTLKRRVGYVDEHVSVTRARLSDMDFESEAEEDGLRQASGSNSAHWG